MKLICEECGEVSANAADPTETEGWAASKAGGHRCPACRVKQSEARVADAAQQLAAHANEERAMAKRSNGSND